MKTYRSHETTLLRMLFFFFLSADSCFMLFNSIHGKDGQLSVVLHTMLANKIQNTCNREQLRESVKKKKFWLSCNLHAENTFST